MEENKETPLRAKEYAHALLQDIINDTLELHIGSVPILHRDVSTSSIHDEAIQYIFGS
jgi:hypothetical protein